MSQRRTIACDICGETYTEEAFGLGFPGWAQAAGITLRSDRQNPDLCPQHAERLAEFIATLWSEQNGMD